MGMSTGGAGTYTEGNAFEAVNQLKQLRQQLDAGSIDVNTFVKQGRELAEFVYNEQLRLGGGGSASAKVGNKLKAEFDSANLGFKQEATGNAKTGILVDLPQEYQQKVRESLLPDNLSPEDRERMLKDIPNDIDINSDRYQIEREGIRQKTQAEIAANEAKARREKSLGELSGLLSQRNDRLFTEGVPQVAEDANVKGIFRSTGFGEALAKEKSRLEATGQEALAAQSLSDRELNEQDISGILAKQQGFQFDGLSRDFSNKDYGRQIADAMRIAQLSQPQQKSGGKSGGQGALSGAASGAATGASFGPWGAAIGAGVGAGAGYFATR